MNKSTKLEVLCPYHVACLVKVLSLRFKFGRSYTSFRSVRTAQVMFAPRNTRMRCFGVGHDKSLIEFVNSSNLDRNITMDP